MVSHENEVQIKTNMRDHFRSDHPAKMLSHDSQARIKSKNQSQKVNHHWKARA